MYSLFIAHVPGSFLGDIKTVITLVEAYVMLPSSLNTYPIKTRPLSGFFLVVFMVLYKLKEERLLSIGQFFNLI
jgi:hypothetical protein